MTFVLLLEAQAAFARLLWFQDPQRSRSIALRVMESKAALPPEAETTACFLIGATLLSEGQFAEARPWLTRATTLRPTADLWMMLSEACRQTGDRPAALDAARRASEMAPDRPRYLEARLELLELLGPADERAACRARLPIIYGYRTWLDARGR